MRNEGLLCSQKKQCSFYAATYCPLFSVSELMMKVAKYKQNCADENDSKTVERGICGNSSSKAVKDD